MKIAVFSDIHGNYEALKSIIDDIKNNNIDMTIFLGDSISLGPESEKCIKLLSESNIIKLFGNHELYSIKGINIDPYIKEENKKHCIYIDSLDLKKYMNNFELKKEITIGNKKILFTHYFLTNNEYPYYSLNIFKDNSYKDKLNNLDYNYVFYGHEHKIEYYELNNMKLYGIGSSGCVKDNITYYHIITINNNDIKIDKVNINYNRDKLIDAFNRIDYPQKDLIASKIFGINTK